MTRTYADAGAFRQALEARLKLLADERHVPLNTLRQKVVMERLLARLFARPDATWRLKGGYAMELRLAERARTTRDLDLAAAPAIGADLRSSHDALLEALRTAASTDLGDHLVMTVAGPGTALAVGGPGGFRFAVTVNLAGRRYAGFHVDLGLDADVGESPEVLHGEDYLAFAGIEPARVLAVSRARQFAEKIHAYTRPRGERTNTRTKDLVDLLLLIELEELASESLRGALTDVFTQPGSHPLPDELPRAPADWEREFPQLAEQTA